MEGQLITNEELLQYECRGNQVLITTTGDLFSVGGITAFHEGTNILGVVNEGQYQLGDIIFSTQNFTSANQSVQDGSEGVGQNDANSNIDNLLDAIGPSASTNKSYRCKDCGVRFATEDMLTLHSDIHDVDEAYYACEFCSASKIHWTEMWLHQCTNTDTTPIICPHCNQNVLTKKQLQVHEDVHNLQKRFPSKRFEGYFEKKLRIEGMNDYQVDWGAKPFICGVCGKPFSKLYEVEYHEKLHTGERPTGNTCFKCGLSYVNRQDLNKHSANGCIGQLSRKTNAVFHKRKNAKLKI